MVFYMGKKGSKTKDESKKEEKKEAKLTYFILAQDYLPEHWNWTDDEKKALQDTQKVAEIIKNRLEKGGCLIEEMYAITHDKDEKKMWDEYKMAYYIKFSSNHIHVLVKFAKGGGETLNKIAHLIGVESNYIEKPKPGRYGYDNNLAYLIHIKYERKYQYDPHTVVTLAGKGYIEYYRENHESWIKGRAIQTIRTAKEELDLLKIKIIDGEVTETDIVMDDNYSRIYMMYPNEIRAVLKSRQKITFARQSLQKDPNGKIKLISND